MYIVTVVEKTFPRAIIGVWNKKNQVHLMVHHITVGEYENLKLLAKILLVQHQMHKILLLTEFGIHLKLESCGPHW